MAVSETRPVSALKQARLDAGLRLVDVATKADCAVSYVSMIEHGYVPPRGVRERLAKALDTPVAGLWPEAE